VSQLAQLLLVSVAISAAGAAFSLYQFRQTSSESPSTIAAVTKIKFYRLI
jgi:hypothetical protein